MEPVVADLTPANVEDLLGGVDLILDGTDNFETRYLINDFAVERGVPWIYGAAVGSYGIAMPVIPGPDVLACGASIPIRRRARSRPARRRACWAR